MSVLALDGAPVPTSEEFDVTFVDPDGSQRCEPLSSCWMVPFERALQVRAFSWNRGKRSFAGWWRCCQRFITCSGLTSSSLPWTPLPRPRLS